jgi:hypothetical protein
MKNLHQTRFLIVAAICVSLAAFNHCKGQDIIAASACYTRTASLSVSWTIGEIATETYINHNIMLTQGFNQGNITIATLSEDLCSDINITVYPNPVNDFFTVKTETGSMMNLKAELYNLSGSKLLSQSIGSGSTTFNMEGFPSSDYILKIYNNLQEIKTFKVIKTD